MGVFSRSVYRQEDSVHGTQSLSAPHGQRAGGLSLPRFETMTMLPTKPLLQRMLTMSHRCYRCRHTIITLCLIAAAMAPLSAQTVLNLPRDMLAGCELDSRWAWDDPNGNDTYRLDAEEGLLRISVSGPHEDMWLGDRGGAPVLCRLLANPAEDFALETHVDLATSNDGYPVVNSVGGLIVRDTKEGGGAAPFGLTFGLQHNWASGTEVILQKPGHSFGWASPGANAAFLRLERKYAERTWSAYYRAHPLDDWTLLASVADADLPEGTSFTEVYVGVFAKTWDASVGSAANIDFRSAAVDEGGVRENAGNHAPARTTSEREIDMSSLVPFGAVGKERTVLNAYREAELMRHTGKGCLTHMWFGGDWPGYHQTRIRVYVDGEREASIDMELGMGHGVGFADENAPWGGTKLGKTGHPSGLYNTYRIPFGRGIRITAQRDKEALDGAAFWWILRGTENLPVTLGGVQLPENARLRLYKLEDYVAKPFEEFALCDVPGAGALYQVAMAGDGLRDVGDWKDISYLEAIMRAYLDGRQRPLQLSSGLEDYFLGTYYFNRGRYANDLAGLTHLDTATNTFAAYRFHDEDPLFFRQGLRLTCRCGEELAGQKLHDPPETRFTTYTWVYQW